MDTPIAVDLLIDPVCEEQHPNSQPAFFIFGMSILNKAQLSGTSLLLLREEDDFRFRVRVSSF
jgi:hypothetical protein